ncbi:hypothetical protein SKAU_G00080830 [Synaphobranchus kaupii]|uniref:Uncharacterized protein n=1 Tax=Synaphobranchus kaupii TaxID=118154 RepID=A0A9Q1J3B0_SYNKA|nr:hypothetical protein SKAU_G00080830 [Synaphobranchus kaupii]
MLKNPLHFSMNFDRVHLRKSQTSSSLKLFILCLFLFLLYSRGKPHVENATCCMHLDRCPEFISNRTLNYNKHVILNPNILFTVFKIKVVVIFNSMICVFSFIPPKGNRSQKKYLISL